MELSKDDRLFSEIQRIKNLFDGIDGNILAIIDPLIQNASFMRITCEDLQDIINRDGVIEEYKHGREQYGVKQSSALQSYNSLIKNYTAVIKQLAQHLPREKRQSIYTPIIPNRHEMTEEEKAEERKRIEADTEEFVRKIKELKEKYPDNERKY